MNHVKSGFRLMLISIGLYLLGVILPMRSKRLLFLASLAARLVRDGVFNAETMQKLNASLQLAHSENALQLPVTVCHRIWDADTSKKIFSEIHGDYAGDSCLLFEDAQQVCRRAVELTPAWLRYGSVDDMMRDASQLFYCSPARLA